MDYRISPLQKHEFEHLIGANSSELARAGALRMTADTKPGFPCRVSLQDAEVGESVLLLNYEHLSVASPYRSSHAIFVREDAETCKPFENSVPESLRARLLSLRAFDANGMMLEADVAHGRDLEAALQRFLTVEAISYIHLHNAKPGCYAARVDRSDKTPSLDTSTSDS